MLKRSLGMLMVLSLTACGGGGGVSSPAAPPPPVPTASSAPVQTQTFVATSFGFDLGTATQASSRAPRFIGSAAKSAVVTLTAVNGSATNIPSNLTTSVTSSLTGSAPYSVAGPNVPPGSDTFTFQVYDAVGGSTGTGKIIATFTGTYTIAAGIANTNTVTLQGVPGKIVFGTLPSLTAGTAITTPQTVPVTIQDIDGAAITGTYASPITISSGDSNANGVQFLLNGATTGASSTVTVTKSTDVVTLVYGGLAEAPVTFSALLGTTPLVGTATESTTNSAIAYTGPRNSTNNVPEIDLYAPSGTGSSFTATLAQPGFADGIATSSFTASLGSGCSTIGTVAGGTTTTTQTWTFTTAANPIAGSCTVTFTGGAGQTLGVIMSYTSNGVGIQSTGRSH